MIKIKDNIDLKELKKFGFEYYEDEYKTNRAMWGRGEQMKKFANETYKDTGYSFECNLHYLIVQGPYIGRPKEEITELDLKEREINIRIDEDWIERGILDKLYDLIQAGLVEKVTNEED